MVFQSFTNLQHPGKPALLQNVYSKSTNNGKSDIGLVLGLSIGLPVGLSCICIVMLSMYFLRRRRQRSQYHKSGALRNLECNSAFENTDETISIEFKPAAVDSPNIWRVSTPKKAHATMTDKGKLEVQEVDDILYRRPPNIYSIKSCIPSADEVTLRRPKTGYSKKGNGRNNNNSWKYESPLSKWFLRSSLYLRNLSDNQVSTANIKNTNVLTSVVEGWALDENISDEHYSTEVTSKSSEQSIASKIESGSDQLPAIQPQIVQLGDMDLPGVKMTLDPRTSKKKARSKLRRHLEYVKTAKPLPLTPNRSKPLRVGRVYIVREEYEPVLVDEIYVSPGEKLRVLATHTDGYCLVERETVTNGSEYLNKDRGIIPSQCLETV